MVDFLEHLNNSIVGSICFKFEKSCSWVIYTLARTKTKSSFVKILSGKIHEPDIFFYEFILDFRQIFTSYFWKQIFFYLNKVEPGIDFKELAFLDLNGKECPTYWFKFYHWRLRKSTIKWRGADWSGVILWLNEWIFDQVDRDSFFWGILSLKGI